MTAVSGKRAVVLGGSGFVGSHLCERLLDEGAAVVSVDNLLTGSELNVRHLRDRKGFEALRQDITEGLEVEGPVDFVFNLASPASPIDYAQLPIETLRVGSIGMENALKLAHRKGARLLQASTSEVYGDPLVHPQREDYWGNVNPVGPRSCYDESKRFAEALCVAYQRVHRVPVRIVRIFNTYGPRMRLNDGRVVPAFVGQALRGEDFSLFGDGSQTRSFCYVTDLVDGIYRLMLSDVEGPVNVGNPREMTIREFAEAVRQANGGGGSLKFHPLPKDDPKQRKPDITRARELLGWEPRVSLEEGLQQTLHWFRTVAPSQGRP
jgi:dTDP-glucose 4,6-dehydratase